MVFIMKIFVPLKKTNIFCSIFLLGTFLGVSPRPWYELFAKKTEQQSVFIGKPVYPVAFYNKTEYNGGICFANAVLQCLFQVPSLCYYVDTLQPVQNTALSIKCLKALRQRLTSNQSSYYARECCWDIVQAFAQETNFYGSDPVSFAYYILSLLCNGSSENFMYSSRNQCLARAFIGLSGEHRAIDSAYLVDGWTNQPISVISCSDLHSIQQDLSFTCIPNLDLMMLASCQRNIEDYRVFKKLALQLQDQLSLIWSGKTGCTATLCGVVVAVDNGMGDSRGHAIAYTLHKGNWIYCNDYYSIENLGNNFLTLAHHIYQVKKGAPMALFFRVNDGNLLF